MTLAYTCLLIAGLLPLVCSTVAKAGAKGYDNSSPREWSKQQSGFRARAFAAEANTLEAFPLFAASLLAAIQTGVAASTINALAVTFVAARVIYIYCYISNKATLRSTVWGVGWVCVLALAVLAIRAAS